MDGLERPSPSSRRGQHFLADRRLAAELVRNAGVTAADLVYEIGAGKGILTEAIAERAGCVQALEVDPALVRRLRARFAGSGHVRITEGDVLRRPVPGRPFRVVANLPFHVTTPILRRLLDPASPLLRADVIVDRGFAIKRASQRPSTLLSLGWTPWFELTISRLIPASRFRPPPSVDAAVLTVTRRSDPLLAPDERDAYLRVVGRGFDGMPTPVRRCLAGLVPRKRFERVARELRFSPDARAVDLDAAQWASLYLASRS